MRGNDRSPGSKGLVSRGLTAAWPSSMHSEPKPHTEGRPVPTRAPTHARTHHHPRPVVGRRTLCLPRSLKRQRLPCAPWFVAGPGESRGGSWGGGKRSEVGGGREGQTATRPRCSRQTGATGSKLPSTPPSREATVHVLAECTRFCLQPSHCSLSPWPVDFGFFQLQGVTGMTGDHLTYPDKCSNLSSNLPSTHHTHMHTHTHTHTYR